MWWGTPPDGLWFTDNETDRKDAFHRHLIYQEAALNPEPAGTKAAFWYRRELEPGATAEIWLRLGPAGHPLDRDAAAACRAARMAEADAFYQGLVPPHTPPAEQQVLRQALAGLLWSKQFYWYDVDAWAAAGRPLRNRGWFHLEAHDVLLMPDKWEYPWFAAWDHAFHAAVAALVDLDLAKEQLLLLTQDRYLHPNGQIPAYEWNFGDVNPPVHAGTVWRVYCIEKEQTGQGDREFLERSFHKLLLNFTWWVNRKDSTGNNVFEGGFLGLDNIGVFDRSAPLPTGGRLEQADGSAWMAVYALDMLEMALELAQTNPAYQEVAAKFYRHFFYIAGAMDRVGLHADELWDEEDGFFYDLLRLPDGEAVRLKVRSLVGLIPLLATAVIDPETWENLPLFRQEIQEFREQHPRLFATVADPDVKGVGDRRLLAVVPATKLRRILARMLDEERFLGPGGIRSLSRDHLHHPYTFYVGGTPYTVRYEPGESTTGMFGGNSNWRGPVWLPLNVLLIQALLKFYSYYGDGFRVPCPTGSAQEMTLWDVAQELCRRNIGLFLPDENGQRPVFGGVMEPHGPDRLLFYEYFHGDTGAGLGASHQTGWTAAVARLIQFRAGATRWGILREGFTPGVNR